MRPICCLVLMLSLPAPADTLVDVPDPAGPGSLAPVFARDGGDVILTWLQRSGDRHALQLATYRDGRFAPAGTIAEGADWFANWADLPGLFVTPGGDWFAHWLEKSADGTYTYDIRMKRSSDRGKTWTAPFVLHNDGTESEHGFVSYYPAGDHATGMIWLDGRRTVTTSSNTAMTLRTAVIGHDGRIHRRRELDQRVCDCCQTAAAMTASNIALACGWGPACHQPRTAG